MGRYLLPDLRAVSALDTPRWEQDRTSGKAFTQGVRRNRSTQTQPGTTGTVRSGRDTAVLLTCLRPGDIAVIDHLDLDGPTAEALVAKGVAAVVNAAPSTSGRYPNLGPTVLVTAGVPLLDQVGDEVFGAVRDGRTARVDGDQLWLEDDVVATGHLLDAEGVERERLLARSGMAAQLVDLVSTATDLLLDEVGVWLDGTGIPGLRASVEGRDVVVVLPGTAAATDLNRLSRFVKRRHPLLVGVEGGADVILSAGLRLDVAVGQTWQLSPEALVSAGEVVVGVDPNDPGVVPPEGAVAFPSRLPAYDQAVLLVEAGAARLVVTAGAPGTLEGLLDRGRADAGATLLTRLRLAGRLVDTPTALALWSRRRRWVGKVVSTVTAGLLGAAGLSTGPDGFDVHRLQDTVKGLLGG